MDYPVGRERGREGILNSAVGQLWPKAFFVRVGGGTGLQLQSQLLKAKTTAIRSVAVIRRNLWSGADDTFYSVLLVPVLAPL